MAVWLRTGRAEFGFEHGLIRRDEFAELLEIQQAAACARQEITDAVAKARTQVEAMQVKAKAECDKLIQDGQARHRKAFEKGFAEGLQNASQEWAATAMRSAWTDHQLMARKTSRVASLVTDAVQRIVESEDRQALYQRALRTVVKMVKDVRMITLRVNESEQEMARDAIAAIAQQLNCPTPIDVVADASMGLGACAFESDQGCIDASLETQLAAIRAAVWRAAERMTTEVANAPNVEPERKPGAGDDEAPASPRAAA